MTSARGYANHLEVERKYDVEDGFVVPDLTGVAGCIGVGDAVRHELVARYFDTTDLQLAASNITMRRRTGGHDSGWTVKLPHAGIARSEISIPLDAAHPTTVPVELAALVAGHLRGRPLTAVADLSTVRLERDLLGPGGIVAATLADDTVTGCRLDSDANPTSIVTWREIEVELADASQMSLKTVGKHLRRHGARRSASPSKVSRVLDVAATRPDPPAAGRSAGATLVDYVRTHTGRLLALDPQVRLANAEDESVHQMRVAARSIYYALRTHQRLIDADEATALRTELRWLADILGTVRDLEVMRVRFASRLAALPDPGPEPSWLTNLGRSEAQARDHLRAQLLSSRYFALLNALDRFVSDPPLTSLAAGRKDTHEARTVLRAVLRRMSHAEAAIAATAIGEERDTALHLLRKRAKRGLHDAHAAIALDIASPEFVDRVARLESLLGTYRDGVIAQRQIRRIAYERATTKRDAYTLGTLAGIERCEARRVLDGLPAAWEPVAALRKRRHGGKP